MRMGASAARQPFRLSLLPAAATAALCLSAVLPARGAAGAVPGVVRPSAEELLGLEGREEGEPRAPLPSPLSLPGAKRIAIRDNPDLQAAATRVRAAAAALGRARAAYSPTLSVGGEFRYTRDTPSAGFGAGRDPYESYSLSLRASWLVFDGFVRKFDLLAAQVGRQEAEAGVAEVQRLLLNGVSQAYHGALLAQESMLISEQDAEFNRQLTDETQKRFDAGAAAKSEVLNFQIRTAQADSHFLVAEREFNVMRVVLAQLLGVRGAELAAELKLRPIPADVAEAAPPTLLAEVAHALGHRPDLLQLEFSLQRMRARLGASKGAYWPRVAVDGAYGETRDDDPRFNDDRDAFSYVGLGATWELFSGGRRKHTVREAWADLDRARKELEARRLAVVSDLRQQIETLRMARAELVLQDSIHRMTEETRGLVRNEYLAGRSSLTRLNEAQTDLVRARGGLALARIRFRQAVEDVASSSGRDLVESLGPVPARIVPSD